MRKLRPQEVKWFIFDHIAKRGRARIQFGYK